MKHGTIGTAATAQALLLRLRRFGRELATSYRLMRRDLHVV